MIGYVLPIARERDRADAAAEVGQRPVVLPRRPHVPDPRRFADGLPPAARLAAVGERRATFRTSIAHDPFAPPAPLRSAAELRMQYGGGTLDGEPARRRDRRDRRESARPAQVSLQPAGTGEASASASAAASRQPSRGESASWIRRTALCVEARDPARAAGPEGRSGVVRQRQAPAACLHAAAHRTRGLSRPARRRRGDGAPSCGMKVVHRRLSAAARSAPEDAAGHAGPGRDRGQHPSGAELGANSSTTPSSCTRRRARRA